MEIFQLSCTCPIGHASEPTMGFQGPKAEAKNSKTRTRCDYQKLYNGLPEKLGRELVKRLNLEVC